MTFLTYTPAPAAGRGGRIFAEGKFLVPGGLSLPGA